MATAFFRVWPEAAKTAKIRELYRMDERERERAMTLLLKEEKLAEIQVEVRAKNPSYSEAKVRQVAIRKYIWRNERIF